MGMWRYYCLQIPFKLFLVGPISMHGSLVLAVLLDRSYKVKRGSLLLVTWITLYTFENECGNVTICTIHYTLIPVVLSKMACWCKKKCYSSHSLCQGMSPFYSTQNIPGLTYIIVYTP